MSAQGQVTDFLRALGKTGEVAVTPETIALQTGVSREQVNKTLYNLKAHGRLELMRGDNGRDIVGLNIVDLEPRQRGGARAPRTERPEPSERRVSVRTPALDEYARAKSRFEALRHDFGDLVEVNFRENPYAEEGLRLKERMANVEAQFVALRTERDEALREYRALRAKRHVEIAEAVAKNGTAIQHGD